MSLLKIRLGPLHLLNRDQIHQVLADHFLRLKTEQITHLGAAIGVDSLGIDLPDPVAGGFHQGTEPLVAFLQGPQQTLPFLRDDAANAIGQHRMADDVKGQKGDEEKNDGGDGIELFGDQADLDVDVLDVETGADDPAPGLKAFDVGEFRDDFLRVVLPLEL